ncbi:Xaa-Pro peptidase family protein [Candidatus Methylomirabilis sp.]|uniref:M24 family metallopeptidase n=1 Tax=Candidatus Methylomirabilis sp. TaxID=2032687 RepID=UPI002A602545|nr:Xaa-Pro peptidase family protein [Candidatus Methylomirabilis sp.]
MEELTGCDATVMIAVSEIDANLYYATRFAAPDPFIFVQAGAEKIVVMSDLEMDRARSQARVDTVLSYSAYERRAREKGADAPFLLDVLDLVLRERGARHLLVPGNFGVAHADGLRAKGYTLAVKREPFFEARLVKSEEEIKAIAQTQRVTEEAVGAAISAVRAAKVEGDGLLYLDGEQLTAEGLRKIMHVKLMEHECVAQHTIVAPGLQGVDPHHHGNGPIRANESIVIDVFPRSERSRYFADMSRTVVKGKASPKLLAMYRAVLNAQERGIELIRDGADGKTIHAEVNAVLEKDGFTTGMVGGRMQGFFHGTGHGVGLDIHEPPRISKTGEVLRSGYVVTVEPGLYYSDVGAIRIEDLVVVTKAGCRNLTNFPKEISEFEID